MKALASAAALAALSLAPPARAQSAAPGLTVRGSATVEQAPDTADLTVSVVTRAPTPGEATQAHRARIAQAKAALERLRSEGATVDVASFGLTEERAPVPPGVRPPDAPPTFRAETRYDVRTGELDKLDVLATAVASSGLFEFDGARFSVRDRGAADDRARRAAFADARHQADLYAEAAGVRLDGVERISDADAAAPDGAYDTALRGSRLATVGLLPPKTIPFNAGVTVTWRIAPR